MTARHRLKRALILTWLVMLAPVPSQAAKGSACAMTQATIARDEAGIRETMAAYNAALNGGKTAAVLPLYTEDGVFMPPYSQSAVGKSAVAAAYDKVFEELQFDVKFTIAELVVIAPNWAYARTNSSGTTFHRSFDKKLAEANQELFIFKKGDDGKWRIARYSFSPTNSPA
ncbi:MAG: SgcJ/EcaC family oxidoreductase [Alphaproteobacteria bacterium]|nr:SgcJ/EcaC family oxidoreductase [Alphaproteobacteria bacterium]